MARMPEPGQTTGQRHREQTTGDMRLRRRKVRKRKATPARSWRDVMRMASIAATLVGGLIYGLGVRHQLAELRDQYGLYTQGSSEAELRYMLGKPDQISPDGQSWSYRNNDRMLTLTLDPSRHLAGADCAAAMVRIDACPMVGTVGLSSTEAQVRATFGRPSAERFVEASKELTYAGLGYRFRLGRGQVQDILHTHAEGGMAYLLAYAWQALP